MKLFAVLFSLIIGFNFSFAQQGYFIRGKVNAADSGQPLQGASVYAQNTTIGTVTDEEGNYKIGLPPGGYDLVISFTDKQTETKSVNAGDANEAQNFVLRNKEKALEDVAIVSSTEVKEGWNIYGSFFKDNFIGKTANSLQTNITNPDVLKFYYSKRRDRLKVMASEPIQIENKALGYTIKYELDSFVYDYKQHASLFTGYPLFSEMTTTDSTQLLVWNAARKVAYEGSILHFMRSLYSENLKENGFAMRYIVEREGKDLELKLNNPYKALNFEKSDSLQVVSIKPQYQEVGILYTKSKPDNIYTALNPDEPKDFRYSQLSIANLQPVSIEQNGYYFDQYDVIINGYWNWTKLADMLPYDYSGL